MVLGWIQSPEDLFRWSGREDYPLTDPAVFVDWHADPDIHPYLLIADGAPRGYGELWVEEEEHSVELARLLIGPQDRRKGYGSILVERLCEKGADLGLNQVCLRVVPTNQPAIGCYEKCGFSRATAQEEALWNAREQHPFRWMMRTVIRRKTC